MDERERYFLNGNWIVDWPGRYETSGVAFHYERTKDSEIVHSRGPLQQDLIVMVRTSLSLFFIFKRNPLQHKGVLKVNSLNSIYTSNRPVFRTYILD